MKQQDYENRFKNELKKKVFPTDELGDKTFEFLLPMLYCNSMSELNLTAEEYNSLLNGIVKDEFSLFEVAAILNNMQKVSPKELGITIHDYAELMLEVQQSVEKWDSLMKPIKNRLVDELNRKAAALEKEAGKQKSPTNPQLRKV